ncbi:pre-rRNA processing [Marasmius tenuissimus]|uniref:Pre-rRNA processing n=1 Tax=Marasmius tenuissimus TaxID=585030 RepID=A0ABR3ACH2_9AGAR
MPDRRESIMMGGLSIEDDLGIVYVVENAQQFWSELEDLVNLPKENIPTLEQLDGTLKRYVGFCACYHEQYLQSPLQLEHACHLILDTELFSFHSERMCDILTSEAQSNNNPHFQFISYNLLLHFGKRRADFFRSTKRWKSLLPLLMDHVLVEIDSDVEDAYLGINRNSSGGHSNVPVPIEAKLRSLGVMLLYEVCRVQKFNLQDLRVFDDAFLDYLFDLVEQTRLMQDDTFNYSVIKLIVALNEQFMVVSVNDGATLDNGKSDHHAASSNRVLRVLMRRLNSSKTFGENMIFMLNRAEHTPEDLCMQLLVLKLIYLLFTSKGTSEYFYTNDLCVLVDVTLREIVDLDEDNESLRHTYLRILHPLLTKTQLRDVPYKRPQILRALENLGGMRDMKFGYIGRKEINPTTKRLVERCLGGDWCVQLKKTTTPDEDASSDVSHAFTHLGLPDTGLGKSAKPRTLKAAKSMEFQKSKSGVSHSAPGPTSSHPTSTSMFIHQQQALPLRSNYPIQPHSPIPPKSPVYHETAHRRPSDASVYSTSSATSLSGVAHASLAVEGLPPSPSVDSLHTNGFHGSSKHKPHHNHTYKSISSDTSLIVGSDSEVQEPRKQRRTAPPPPGPPKRRKPPAIPVKASNVALPPNGSKVTFTPIKSSASAG